MRWLVSLGADPAALQIPKPHKPRPRAVIATPEELHRLTSAAAPWLRCWLILTAGHGLRFSEAMRLSPAHVDLHNRTLTHRTKGQQTNTIPISDQLYEIVTREIPQIHDPNTPLVALMLGHPIGRTGIQDAWTKLKKDAGVNPLLRTHDLRRTLAVRIYDLTKDVRAVQQQLGHSNISTTAGYLEHRDPGKLRDIINQMQTPNQRPPLQN